MQREIWAIVMFLVMILAGAVGWYEAWVRPHDEMMQKVVQCSRETGRPWPECYEEIMLR